MSSPLLRQPAVLFLLCLFSAAARAQTGVGVGTASPHASAALDVSSSSQGFLPPRLTYAQRTAISNAAAGLLVYQSNTNASPAAPAGYYYYTGTAWLPLQTQGDNLGNHTATQDLNLNGNQLGGGTSNNVGLVAATTLELGNGVAGKEANAGKIGYNAFGSGALDIVGAGTSGTNRKVKIWAEGGTTINTLAGTGTRVVTADASGNLGSTAATALLPAENGVQVVAGKLGLGGALIRDTDFDLNTRRLRFGIGAITTTTVEPAGLDLTFGTTYTTVTASTTTAYQTFTAGQTGVLRQVELGMNSTGTSNPFTLNLRQGAGASGAVLGSGGGASPGGLNNTVASVAVALNLPVVQGQTYTLQLVGGPFGAVRWGYLPDYYPGGQAGPGAGSDYSFRTTIGPVDAPLTLSSSGVGVGSDAPDWPLTVRGSGSASQLLSLQNVVGSTKWHYNLEGNGLNLAESGVADYRLFVQDGGNVGIGTGSPAARLHVAGDVALDGNLLGQSTKFTVALSPTGSFTWTWNHNLGYQPVLMLSVENNGNSGTATVEYINASYTNSSSSSTAITVRNTNPALAAGNALVAVHALVVGR